MRIKFWAYIYIRPSLGSRVFPTSIWNEQQQLQLQRFNVHVMTFFPYALNLNNHHVHWSVWYHTVSRGGTCIIIKTFRNTPSNTITSIPHWWLTPRVCRKKHLLNSSCLLNITTLRKESKASGPSFADKESIQIPSQISFHHSKYSSLMVGSSGLHKKGTFWSRLFCRNSKCIHSAGPRAAKITRARKNDIQ